MSVYLYLIVLHSNFTNPKNEITKMVEESVSARKGCNFKVNLYASVVAVTPPRRTKRGDWTIAATLLDESCPTPMTINIFCKKQERLPQLIWMGDVIRIHRAAVEVRLL